MTIIVCKSCAEILHSKHRHHFVMCECPNRTFADGGSDYFRSGGNDLNLVIGCNTIAEAKRLSQTITLQNERKRATQERDKDMCVSLIQTIDMNINNDNMSDKEFREFVRRSLPVTVKQKSLTKQTKG